MSTIIEASAPKSLADADLKCRGRVWPSPVDWRDQIIYFAMVDRFSTGSGDPQTPYDRANPQSFQVPRPQWMDKGKEFCGGTISGLKHRLDYLKAMGVTTLWVSPVFRQRRDMQTYHGYAIQNFLDVDPRYGSRQDLRDLVDAAHDRGMYVLLDVVYNHTGNNWYYDNAGQPQSSIEYRGNPPYPFHGWRLDGGGSGMTAGQEDDGVWPREFMDIDWYHRRGAIKHWDAQTPGEALSSDVEFRRGDFGDLKDLRHSHGPVLSGLIRAYEYWIALSDCDGFRIDTVKHVSLEASRNFCGAIHEFSESIGKHNFLLLAEVAGGAAMASSYLEIFRKNVDAVLDFGQPSTLLCDMVKGFATPKIFFDQFGPQHDAMGSHRELGRYHVSMFNDHDHIGREKARFMAGNDDRDEQVAHAVGVQLTTLGIPCIYYGTEQAFSGSKVMHDPGHEPLDSEGRIPWEDRYLRETMFGGGFGAFGTNDCHFFDVKHPAYMRIAAIASVRARKDMIGMTLRRGRQYQRKIQTAPAGFRYPNAGELAAWSRIMHDQEVLVVLNTNGSASQSALVEVAREFRQPGSTMSVLYHSGSLSGGAAPDNSSKLTVQATNEGPAVQISLGPSQMVILA